MGEQTAVISFIAILAGVILLFAVAVIVASAKERRRVESLSPSDRAAHNALVAAESEHRAALREYKNRTVTAEKVYRREKGAIDALVRSAQAEMQKAEKTGRSLIQSYRAKDGTVALFEHQIIVNGKAFPLDESISAAVDSSGNLARTKRSTLTRMTAGGVILGPVGILAGGMLQKKKVHDDRELYLLIEGREFTALLTCNAEHGGSVRQFAAKISQASKTVKLADERHEEAVRSADKLLEKVSMEADQVGSAIEDRLEKERAEDTRVVIAQQRLLELGELPKGAK